MFGKEESWKGSPGDKDILRFFIGFAYVHPSNHVLLHMIGNVPRLHNHVRPHHDDTV